MFAENSTPYPIILNLSVSRKGIDYCAPIIVLDAEVESRIVTFFLAPCWSVNISVTCVGQVVCRRFAGVVLLISTHSSVIITGTIMNHNSEGIVEVNWRLNKLPM
jgi:hypothetical protein